MGRIRQATLYWYPPRTLQTVYNSKICISSWGLYAISRTFGGKETLLYVGLTFDQCFMHRIIKHEMNWFKSYRGTYLVRFGEFQKPCYITKDLVEDVESALIYELKPKHNISKKYSYTFINRYRVFNIGFRGLLPKEVCMLSH